MLTENLTTMWMDSLSFSRRTLKLNQTRGMGAGFGKIKGVTAKPKHDFIKGPMSLERN
jgi:hypothetical protein